VITFVASKTRKMNKMFNNMPTMMCNIYTEDTIV